MRNVIQSFKKVLNFAPASIAAATLTSDVLVTGTDSVAAGQTSVTDSQVPTGSVIKTIVIQEGFANLVSIASFLHWTIQIKRGSQTAFVHPQIVGGDIQRNQVFHQELRVIGKDQNTNVRFVFKIPKKFQRVREGDIWSVYWICDTITTRAGQAIYKFYR